jgi:plasmid stability protein
MIGVTMPKSVQIRDVPDEVVATMQARAAAAGMSMSEYLRSELVSMAAKPTVADVIARARARHGGIPGPEIVRIIREMRDDPEAR